MRGHHINPNGKEFFKFGAKDVFEETELKNVLLFDFELTNKGCLKKKSRDYLKSILEI